MLRERVRKHFEESEGSAGALKTIYLFLTRKCNLGCKHCYIEGVGPARDLDFDLASIQKLIDQAVPHGLKKVKVSGGEPFVRRDVIDILRFLDERGLEIVLETNGTLFAPDTVDQLATLRKFTVFISLDHIDEAEHDDFRGLAGSYNKTVNVLRQMGETNVESVVTTTANRKNFDRCVEIVDAVIGWGIKRHRTLLNIHPLGNARSHLDNAITLDEAEILISQLFASEHFRAGRAYMTLPPALMPLEFLRDLHTCGWGNSVLGLLSNGDVSMCSASYDDPAMIGGNAFRENFIDIWKNGAFFRELREIGDGKVQGVCSNCVFYKVCRGVCRMSSYSHYGTTDAPYPLCQEVYNRGAFPKYALVDPERDCRFGNEVIKTSRVAGTIVPISALIGGAAPPDH
jgi:radical SAM protein with 4Fe4S-binding SPASM domain